MTLRLPALVLLLAAGTTLSAAASEDLDRAAAAGEADLEASLKELSALRERIAAEKLPLTRELGDLEDRLKRRRQEHDQALRGIDTGNLDLTTAQAELKLRQEEVAYAGNLLDEYTRALESRLNVVEAARYAGAIVAAKDAPTNPDLSPPERLARQLAVVSASLTRLDEAVGGTRFAGTAVDPRGVLAEGRFALIGPVALFASDDGSAAGLALPQAGSAQPAVRPLDEEQTASVAAVVNSGSGFLPLDPTRGAALRELVERWSLIDLFKKGGPIMWPLLAVSILALGTVIERVLFILGEQKRRDARALQRLLEAVEQGDLARAVQIGRESRFYVVRALTYALQHREKSLSGALLYSQAQELKRFSRGLPILDTAITIAPLLGLLGTVTGMMHSFSLIGGELSAPGAITGGIAEALIATAFGLGIAILALIPFNYLNNRIEEARHELDAAATQLELLVHPAPGTPAAAIAPASVSSAHPPANPAHAGFAAALRAAQE
ncbi:MAG: MotA/TolQ/ExbB proton channel family protein [Candidatus Polarisedimenticolia bacterium]